MQDQTDHALFPPLEPVPTGLKGRCPRCGQGQLFDGMLKFRPHCSNCGLDFSAIEVGDGAVVPVLMVVNAVALGAALAFENAFSPPVWLHILIWPLVILALCVWLTRLLKGVLLAMHFAKKGTGPQGGSVS